MHRRVKMPENRIFISLKSKVSFGIIFYDFFFFYSSVCIILTKVHVKQKLAMKKSKKNILVAQRGARTHDPEIKSLMLYRLS